MQIVYQTIDGAYFGEQENAQKHEENVLKCVRMWDWYNRPTTDTSQARVVHLVGDHAGAYFKAMVQVNPSECEEIDSSIIDDEDIGWFYWDECAETYRFIDEDIVNTIVAAKSARQEN